MIDTPKQPELTAIPFDQILIRHFSTEVQLRPEFVFFFLLEGSLQIDIFEKKLLLQTHDIVFIKPYEVHAVTYTSPDIHVLALFIDKDYLHTFCPNIPEIDFEQHMIRHSERDLLYVSLCTSLADIILHTIKTDSSSRLKLLSSISSILITLLDAFGSKQLNSRDNPSYVQERISLLWDYLNDNYPEKITLSSAADVLGIHPQYFSAFFKKHFHTTFIDYLTTLRVNKTLTILANTRQNITEIALNHGFSNHKTYSAAFRKLHGITPSSYRKEHTLANQNTLPGKQSLDYFPFFQRYWQTDSLNREDSRVLRNHLNLTFLSFENQNDVKKNTQTLCFSIGRASAVLRSDIQAQIREARKELHITTLRLRDIFSNDLFVYYEDEEKRPMIN